MTPPLQTNRDLYLALDRLSKQHAEDGRSLEAYLLAVLDQSESFRDRASLTLTEFFELIASGFTGTPAPFNDAWRDQYDKLPRRDAGYAGWQAMVIRQIVDLREMDENGALSNEMRYFGVTAPRKSYWYNFDPHGYLECAMAGSLGGWEPGDDTGRDFVPGPVAVMADDGSIQAANPEDLPNPTFDMPVISWELFQDFVVCGQVYE